MFTFKHMKTPAWAKSNTDIYFLVLDSLDNKYGYIGLQDVDLVKGICHNICYKTNKKFRGQGKSKYYLEEFIEWCPFEFDLFKANVRKDNIASIRMLEYCGFEKVSTKNKNYLKVDIESIQKEIKQFDALDILFKTKEKEILNNAKKLRLKTLEKIEKENEVNYFNYKLKRFDF